MPKGLESALSIVERGGIARPQDLAAAGLPREYLHRLHRCGKIMRAGRGLYMALGTTDPHLHLALAAARVPHGVICLRSAAALHGLIGSDNGVVWMAVDRKARKPKVDGVKLQIVRFSGADLTEGIEEHDVCGVKVRVTSPAKTIVDLFRYRRKPHPGLGTHVAADVLRNYKKSTTFDMVRLAEHVQASRMTRVMEPYLQMLD